MLRTLISILGPTATGKTTLAANLAAEIGGEIISADSRQVYKGMDIGTGKDLADYIVDNKVIPYHLVDIKDPGYEYNVFEFQKDFINAFNDIIARKKIPILCGGTGLYLESVIQMYSMHDVPENKELREHLSNKDHQELIDILTSLKALHNVSDISDRKRLVRAIEIQFHQIECPDEILEFPDYKSLVFGINFDRQIIRERITNRLKTRLEEEGMLDEIRMLLNTGLKAEQLTFYGLEYKYLTEHITGKLSYEEMFAKLNTAIHQFAKRQMTWFRRMEKRGTKIHWIDGEMDLIEKVKAVRLRI